MHIQVRQHSQPESARCGYSVFVPLQELDTGETLLKIENSIIRFLCSTFTFLPFHLARSFRHF
jgi:hypothetical protein